MIDWFRGEIDFLHDPIPSGRVLSLDVDGSITWETAKKIVCRSTHETSIHIKSVGGDGKGRATALMIDGNLSKFLQGHNVIGIRDLNRLLLLTFFKIFHQLASHFQARSDYELAAYKIYNGDYKVKMLDINQLYDCGNDASVEAWLHAAHMRALSRHGRASRDKGTVYLGQHSRRWAMKFYNKHRELTAKGNSHQLPATLQGLGLEQFIQGKLRAELRLFAKELEERHGITHGYHINEQRLDDLFNDYLQRIDMTTQATLIDEQLLNMPRTLQGTYQLWRQGADLRQLLPLRTFYRHRRDLLTYGVDINAMCLTPEHNNVVPLMRIVEAVPVPNPDWAYQLGLIA